MRGRSRPAYVERKVALERARREALATHEQPCYCVFCMTDAQFKELVEASLARNAKAGEVVPF